MTLSRQFFETFPPEVARGILEGRPLRIHAAGQWDNARGTATAP